MKKKNHKKILVILTILLLILDQAIKILAYIQGWNITATQAVITDDNGVTILMSIIIVCMMIRYLSNDNSFIKLDTKIILTFAISGAIGNLIDRIWHKEVITMIPLRMSVSLNLAYLYIFIAWIGMAIILTKNSMRFLKEKKSKKVRKNEYKKNKN